MKLWSITKLEQYFKNTNIDYDTALFSSKLPHYHQDKNPWFFMICPHPITPPSSLAPVACSFCYSCIHHFAGDLQMFLLSMVKCLHPSSRADSDSNLKIQLKHHITQGRIAFSEHPVVEQAMQLVLANELLSGSL